MERVADNPTRNRRGNQD
jgi:hypothetical protein